MKFIMPINQCPNNRALQRYFYLSRIPNDKRRKKFHNPRITAKKRLLHHYIKEKIVTLRVSWPNDNQYKPDNIMSRETFPHLEALRDEMRRPGAITSASCSSRDAWWRREISIALNHPGCRYRRTTSHCITTLAPSSRIHGRKPIVQSAYHSRFATGCWESASLEKILTEHKEPNTARVSWRNWLRISPLDMAKGLISAAYTNTSSSTDCSQRFWTQWVQNQESLT